MEWCERVVVFRVRRAWARVAVRLGIRRTGLRRLRRDVRTCEYEDVHVMWEMLRKSDGEMGLRRDVRTCEYEDVHVMWEMLRKSDDEMGRRRRSESGEEMQRSRRRRRAADLWANLFDWAPCNLCRNF